MERRAAPGGVGALAGQDPPRAAANQDKQCGHRCGERGKRRTLFRRGGLHCRLGLRLYRDADPQRIDPYRLGDVPELDLAQIGNRGIEPALDLAIGVL